MFGTFVDCNLEVEGKRLTLVPTTKNHLAKCQALVNDPDTSRYLASRFAYTDDQELEWFKQRADDPASVVWSIQLGEEHIGQADIHGIDPRNRTASTGIVIDKNYWGKGVATAVMKARALYAKNSLNLVALYTEICIANEGSWKAAQKAGYKQYGQKPFGAFVEGQYHDMWLGCLTL